MSRSCLVTYKRLVSNLYLISAGEANVSVSAGEGLSFVSVGEGLGLRL